MLVTGKNILTKANKGKYAVGAFNINNMEILQSVVRAAEKLKSPIIVQTTEGAIEYAGIEYLINLVYTAAMNTRIPICLHLDHGKDIKLIKKAIDVGYTSVMFDGSHLPLNKNIELTKKIVKYAHKKRVSVEAEIGTIGGKEDKVKSKNIILTEPGDAYRFVKETKVDSLAIAIGTSHGAYKFLGRPKLDIKRLKEIKKKVKIPLVLHGASGIPQKIVDQATRYGAHFGRVKGVPDSEIKLAVKNGINKINIDSDLRLSFTAAVRKVLQDDKAVFDPRKILGPARDLIQKTVEHKINLFGSKRKS